jgi:outer membrane protein assembly factor BamD
MMVVCGLTLNLACASNDLITAAPGEADKVLLDRGNEALAEKKWLNARQYFTRLLDGYPQSPHRAEATLGIGDSYLGENNAASSVFATNQYREFLAFYPTNPRADYAQYQLGMVHLRQMLGPQRDQTETKEAIKEFQTFIERYPNSKLLPEARQRLREAKDRLADGELQVGIFYFNVRLYASAEARFRHLLEADPEYTRRDSLYFHLAETLERTDRKAEALPYYERLVREFEQSEFLEEAHKRIGVLKGSVAGL